MRTPKKVFISYAREDAAPAEKLHAVLAKHPGLRPWLDKVDLLPGADWKSEIFASIENSDFILLLLSLHSTTKTGFVQREVREALERILLLPPGERLVIPVRLDPCTPRNSELRQLHYLDLFLDWDAGVKSLFKALGVPQYTHKYVALGDVRNPSVLGTLDEEYSVPEDQVVFVNTSGIPSLEIDLMPSEGMERRGAQLEVFLKLWTIASYYWPRSLYRKDDWKALDRTLFTEKRGPDEKKILAETIVRLWALAKEMPEYDEDDWRALRKLVQRPAWGIR